MQFIQFCNQHLYAAPTVNQEYENIQSCNVEQMKSSSTVILCGDCRMDSPGFSAIYSFMDCDSNIIVTMAHGDKHQLSM